MEYDNNQELFNFASGLVLGAVIGAGVALLTAPRSGRRTRRKIRRRAGDLRHGAEDRWDEFADEVKAKVDDAVRGARKQLG